MRIPISAYVLLACTVVTWEVIGLVGGSTTHEYQHYYFLTWLAHDMFVLAGFLYYLLTQHFGFTFSDDNVMCTFDTTAKATTAILMSFLSMLTAMTW